MKKIIVGLPFAVVVIALVVIFLQSRPATDNPPSIAETQNVAVEHSPTLNEEEFSDPSIGLSFNYPAGPNGLSLTEQPGDGTEPALLKTLTLLRSEDALRMETNPPIGGEGPAAISVAIFKNEQREFPLAAAQRFTTYSNYNLKTSDEREVVVGGANAIAYTTDGLFPAETIVVAHDSYIYIFTGQFETPDSSLKQLFADLVESVTFIPSTLVPMPMSAKIDINVVCEGALAYMTFESGEKADEFVVECKDGKHPEVIERFKADLNITDERTI
jgi:hypothetical protein